MATLLSAIGSKEFAVDTLDIFPISFKVRKRAVVIVGGDGEALAKARLAVKTSANVRVIAPRFEADFSGLNVEITLRRFQPADLEGAVLVFVAQNSPDARQAIFEARRQHIALNVIDRPELCDFYTPAIVERAPVSIAISSEGTAPVLARLIRARIETALDPDLGLAAKLAGELRHRVVQLLPEGRRRRRFFEDFLNVPSGETVKERRVRALQILDMHATAPDQRGCVWLIGAGPGAQDLLTLRAQRLLQEADMIVHGDQVPRGLVEMGRRDAEVRVVKAGVMQKPGHMGQMLADLAGGGKKIAWLVPGDPRACNSGASLRTSAVLDVLQKAGIENETVPGVKSDVPINMTSPTRARYAQSIRVA